MRIGFLFNHDHIHQVAHSLPIALALARTRPDITVVVAVTSDRLAAEIERLGGDLVRSGALELNRLTVRTPGRRIAARLASSLLPAAKFLVYGDNLDFFASLDLLVVAEKTSLLLKRHARLKGLRIVHTRHGAGDRAIGFDKASAGFDLVLVAGEKIRRRLIEEAGVSPGRIRVVGYPKFDVAAASPPPFSRDEARPVVLYNPHVSPHLSSWYRMGAAVLDWFVDHPEYRLIFAPHVMLFHRRIVVTIDKLRFDRPGRLARRVRDAPNIHVDLGSSASTDMSYTRAADIYLGDVSSQVYEFLHDPRPCLFLDAHETAWEGDASYGHWRAGPVVRSVEALGMALRSAREDHVRDFAAVQRRMIAETFDLDEARPSSERAADAIAEFAGMPARAPAYVPWGAARQLRRA